jgi:hypothetical protein
MGRFIFIFTLILQTLLVSGSTCEISTWHSEEEILKALMQRNSSFIWLSGRCRADINADGETMSGSLFFKLRKDSVMLVSVRKFGLEAAKIYADTSTYTILYKLENTYESGQIASLGKQYGLQANLEDLQQLIAGNVLLPDTDRISIATDSLHAVISSIVQDMDATYYLGKDDLMLRKMTLKDKSNRLSTLYFDDYRQVEGIGFVAFQRLLEFEGDGAKARIKIDVEEMNYNTPVDVRFTLPSHYEKIN